MTPVTGPPGHGDPGTVSSHSRKPRARQEFRVPVSFACQHGCAVYGDGRWLEPLVGMLHDVEGFQSFLWGLSWKRDLRRRGGF